MLASTKASRVRDLNGVREQALQRSGQNIPGRGNNRHSKHEVGMSLASWRNRKKAVCLDRTLRRWRDMKVRAAAQPVLSGLADHASSEGPVEGFKKRSSVICF